MNLGLRDKNVLITSGSKGVGLACAQVFRAEGARIALVSRSHANLDAARELLGEAFTVAADLADHVKAAAMVEWPSRKRLPASSPSPLRSAGAI